MSGEANKKIAILIKRLNHGGAEKVCVVICNELIRRNYNVELWLLEYKDTTLSRQLSKNVIIKDLKKNRVRKSIIPLIILFLKEKPKMLLVFNIELALLTIVIKKILFLRTRIFVRSINTLSHAYKASKKQWNKFLSFKMIKILLPVSDKIIAQSKGMQEDLIHSFKIPNHKIVTIHNPALNFSNNSEKTNNRKINNDFLYIGRLQPQKGLENMIKIFNMAFIKNPNIHLTLAGEGPEEMKLKELSETLGLSSAITFLGYQPNALQLFKKAKATLLTSLYEGFPNVLVESISVGTPVVSFDCPSGPKDIIVQGVNGILIPNFDFEAFSNTLISIANGVIHFNKEDIIKTSYKFSVSTIIKQYEEVFKNTL